METAAGDNSKNIALLFSTLIIAVCGLVYELLAGTLSSYLLGDSIYQFSIVIGVFMASMGLGSYLTRYLADSLQDVFVLTQTTLGVIGGFSTLFLYFTFVYLDNYSPFLLLVSVIIGILIGLEIPIIIRILKGYRVLRLNVSNVLTADYIGALGAALLFPLILVPQLGLFRTALLFGCMNVFVAGVAIYVFRNELKKRHGHSIYLFTASVFLIGGFIFVGKITGVMENRLYAGEIIYSQSTKYQKVVISRYKDAINMYINGNLQFNSADEYRYHEALVHPALSHVHNRRQVLILGGGDGLAAREVLKYRDVEKITLVDIDPVVTDLFSSNPLLTRLNRGSLSDKKVTVINDDAWKFLERTDNKYNLIIVDLPDPNDINLSKFYTASFYKLLIQITAIDGILVTQATSPFFARQAFWCIKHTIGSIHSPYHPDELISVIPYHVYVPSFGEWGFVMASPVRIDWDRIRLKTTGRYLNNEVLNGMRIFSEDISEIDTDINTLQSHALAYYYEKGWSTWFD
ncbi:MAG: polyamine aminopropyltransferase [Gammaproteobacteria bacterium]|nr:polyamine aminopropyltransferase [Gammaproteobacteria bacterium]